MLVGSRGGSVSANYEKIKSLALVSQLPECLGCQPVHWSVGHSMRLTLSKLTTQVFKIPISKEHIKWNASQFYCYTMGTGCLHLFINSLTIHWVLVAGEHGKDLNRNRHLEEQRETLSLLRKRQGLGSLRARADRKWRLTWTLRHQQELHR